MLHVFVGDVKVHLTSFLKFKAGEPDEASDAKIMKITNAFFNPISAFAQTNLIIELKLTV